MTSILILPDSTFELVSHHRKFFKVKTIDVKEGFIS